MRLLSNERPTDDDLRQLMWTPGQAQANYVEFAKQSRERKNVLLSGNRKMDSEILPLFYAQARIICARPGGGKTTYAIATSVLPHARRRAAEKSKKAGLIVTYDQTIEELEGIIASQSGHTLTDVAWGRVPIEYVEKSVEGRELLPIYYLGKSGVTRRRRQPRMTVDNVMRAIEILESDQGIEVELLMVDFMQIVPTVGRYGRGEQVGEAYSLYHELIQDLQCFGLFLSQANRDVEKEKIKIPRPHNAEWSDLAFQFGHQFVGLWRPWNTEPPAIKCPLSERHLPLPEKCWFCHNKGLVPQIEVYYGGSMQKMPVAANLFISQFPKHRFEEPNKTFYQYFDTRLVKLADIEFAKYLQGKVPEFD